MPSLHDAILRHRLYLDGLLKSIVADFNAAARELDSGVRAVFADLDVKSLGDLTKANFNRLITDLMNSANPVILAYLGSINEKMQRFIAVEREMYSKIFREAAGKRNVAAPTAAGLWAIIGAANIAASGSTYVQHQDAFRTAALSQLERTTRAGYANKTDVADVVKQIRGTQSAQFRDGVFQKFNKWSASMTGTLFAFASSKVNHDIAARNFDQYQWISVIDDVTTDICIDRNEVVYTYGEGPIPPAHYNCRSDIIPYIGESPPTSFASWLDQQPSKILADIFGERAPTLDNVRPLTLDQFNRKIELILT